MIHWGMALLVLSLSIGGVALTATLAPYYATLVSVHRSSGIAVLALAGLRLLILGPSPPRPPALSRRQRRLVNGLHLLSYGLMIALPLVGWGMLSAAPYPITIFGSLELPAILPRSPVLYALLRPAHTVLAYLLFAALLVHTGAVLGHGLIRRAGARGGRPPGNPQADG